MKTKHNEMTNLRGFKGSSYGPAADAKSLEGEELRKAVEEAEASFLAKPIRVRKISLPPHTRAHGV